jgi:hypothetical protein
MFRTKASIAAAILMSATIIAVPALAQTAAPAPEPKKSRLTLTREKIKEMRAKWKANRPKLKACRAEVKKKGLSGDDRWFFISECMEKA